MTPEISVIIPYFNRKEFLPRTLRSLENQDIDPSAFKVFVVDDGSNPPLELDTTKYSYEIELITHDKNLGLPSALNSALKKIDTRFFVRIDSDDYVHNRFLSILRLKFSLDHRTNACAVDYIKVSMEEDIIGVFSFEEEPIGCGIMFRTEILKIIGMYHEDMHMGEEIEFLRRFNEKYQLSFVSIPLYRYCIHDGNMTNDKSRYDFFKKKIKESKNA